MTAGSVQLAVAVVKLPKLTQPRHLPPEKLSPYVRCGQNPGEAAAVPAASIGHDGNSGRQRPGRTRSEYGLHGKIQAIHRRAHGMRLCNAYQRGIQTRDW